MALLGRIEQWNDDRGYGFVRPLESQQADGARAFVHVRAIARAGRRPADGDLIRYETERDDKGRLNAVSVAFVNADAMRSQARARREARTGARDRREWGRNATRMRHGALAVAAIALAGGWALGAWPAWVPLAYLVMSVVSFLAYAHDKAAAERGQWRTPESTLHALDLFCGWPGGLLAQHLLRHKSSKRSYQAVFWITVLLNGAVLAWLAQGDALEALPTVMSRAT